MTPKPQKDQQFVHIETQKAYFVYALYGNNVTLVAVRNPEERHHVNWPQPFVDTYDPLKK